MLESASSREADDKDGAEGFYKNILMLLRESRLPFLVGGAYAFVHYTGIRRPTKDLDIFIRREDYEPVAEELRLAGYEAEMTYPHWLAKAYSGQSHFVDLIFSSGNGVARVDDGWFNHAVDASVLGVQVRLCPIEETVWSKAFIMERERFDGADIIHLLRIGCDIDWHRLRERFGDHWRVLLSHLVLFGFAYPGHRNVIPAWLMEELVERLRDEIRQPDSGSSICAGTLLSREQYLPDLDEQGYIDARILQPDGMTKREREIWTESIPDRAKIAGNSPSG